jgi:hypothetical protein
MVENYQLLILQKHELNGPKQIEIGLLENGSRQKIIGERLEKQIY